MDTIKSIKIVTTAIFTAIAAKLGDMAIPIFMLLGGNIVDYFTAIWAAPHRGERVSSDRGLIGIKKKVSMYVLILVAAALDILISYGADAAGIVLPAAWIFTLAVTIWLICNELISILENLADVGLNLPPFLMPIVQQVKKTVESKAGEGQKDD